MQYVAPIEDIKFSLRASGAHDIAAAHAESPEAFGDTVDTVLTAAGRFFAERVAPGNRSADVVAARLVEGKVIVPDEISRCWLEYVQGGWSGLHAPEEFGGQALSKVLSASVAEMLNSSNLALGSGLLLCEGAIEALLLAGSQFQRDEYLPRLVEGSWAGTMNLTESQAGSDLSQVRTIARRADDHYRLKGTKVFITFGEQEFTENILHLVLARTPDAPPGVKGISLFICPKFCKDAAGGYTIRNDIRCLSIEHKLGIKASPTCVLSFGESDGAVGYLVGEENKGLDTMFLMMNAARFTVGVQGIGIAERAYQGALAYARDRVQGKPVGSTPGSAATILNHPDVRRLLMTIKASVEASRSLALYLAARIDGADLDDDPVSRQKHRQVAEFLVPIHKGHATELAVELTSLAVQVFGGMGFIEQTGIAQLYRDARILPIYEGTTSIQANDLIGRKTLRDGGEAGLLLVSQMRLDAHELDKLEDGKFLASAHQLAQAIDAFESTLRWVLDTAPVSQQTTYAASVPYLRLSGYALGAWQMARSIRQAAQDLAAGRGAPGFLQAKISTGLFYLSWIAPQCAAIAQGIFNGSKHVMDTEIDFL